MGATCVSIHAIQVRCLHAGHFAFMRALVQGIDSRQSWDRYLRLEGTDSDMRQIKRTISWIRDAFAAAAKRHRRPGTARLVLMTFAQTSKKIPAQLSLTDFIHVHNLENFSEDEQISQYQQHYGMRARAQSRQARLVTRQLEALNWLQQLIAQAPQIEDPIAHWIDPGLAGHLGKSGLHTLGELVAHIQCFGQCWWTSIDAIGAGKATRIAQWVELHRVKLGADEKIDAKTARSSASQMAGEGRLPTKAGLRRQIRPINQMVLPPLLQKQGPLRAPKSRCLIPAEDDLAAIRIWLHSKSGRPPATAGTTDWPILGAPSHTQRAYWKEAERFLLWLMIERQIGLSSITSADCMAYAEFLAAPLPDWCAPRGREKWHPQWRPFEGPLSLRGRRFAQTVLRALYRYLMTQGYLHASPWEAIALPIPVLPTPPRRCFDARAWDVIDQALESLPPTSANQRLAVAVALITATGMRLSEVARARVDDLYPTEEATRWQLRVIDRAGASCYHDLPAPLVIALLGYLNQRGLDPQPQAERNHGARLLGMATDIHARAPWSPGARRPFDNTAGIGTGSLGDQIKQFFLWCGNSVKNEPMLAAKFASASSEWLRRGRTTSGENFVSSHRVRATRG